MPPANIRKPTAHDNDSDSSHERSFADPSADDDSPDTEDELANPTRPKSKKTQKRKYRATDTTNFGATLQSLLSTDAPSALPLSLKPSVSRRQNDAKLELKARRVLKTERKDKEDKGRVTDVIGGWGGESERALRKVAQRGGQPSRSRVPARRRSLCLQL